MFFQARKVSGAFETQASDYSFHKNSSFFHLNLEDQLINAIDIKALPMFFAKGV